MALIKLGEMVSGIRGTIGGVTYSANKSGLYAKSWGKSPALQTIYQTPIRAIIGSLSAQWRDLTAGERGDWDIWAADLAQERTNSLGEPYYLSGYGQFCAVNTRLLSASHAILTTAPVGAYPAAPAITACEFFYKTVGAYARIAVMYNAGTFPAGTAIITYTRYVPQGIWSVAHSGWIRLDAKYDPGVIGRALYGTVWSNRYPQPAVGDQLFWRVYKQSAESLRSPVITATSIYYID